ncbi:MAG: DNA primase [Proteobacteria bacterium]|nr:DNA primase [Pseudomonadota bacterium]
MAGRIPQNFIDDLLSRIDIVDVVDAYVPLKRAGKNHQARCPFHEEKTPSFTVSQDKQFYHCFGCGANGTAISFLMEHGGMGFIEAVEELASRVGMTLPAQAANPAIGRASHTTELYELMELVVRFYRGQLKEHARADRAKDYLKSRGLTGELAAAYEIGYAPPGWENILNALGGSDAARSRLEKIGLLLEREHGGYYDRFRDRIMFPIRDARGRAIGFGGRVLGDAEPKYLNSPETPIFSKGRELYGLYQARQQQRELSRVYIVEGYMDVLALAQFGIHNAVATLGTAATTDHLQKLFRQIPQLVFCFDGDTAGRKAAWRAMELCLPLLKEGRQILFRFMPEGEDPDSYVRNHGRAALEDLQAMVPLSDYLLETLKSQVDLKTREGRAGLIERALPYVQKIPPGALRELLIQDLSIQGRIELDALKSMCQAPAAGHKRMTSARVKRQNPSLSPVRKAIRFLLHHPQLSSEIENLDDLATVDQHGIPFLIELLEFIRQRQATTTANILEHWRDSRYEKHLHELAGDEEMITDAEILKLEFTGIVHKLVEEQRQSDRLRQVQSVTDTEQLRSLYPPVSEQ